jgi:putative transposase
VLWQGIPEPIHCDNGLEFATQELRKRLAMLGTGTLYVEQRRPWENGYCESYNGKLQDEGLNAEILYSRRIESALAFRTIRKAGHPFSPIA